MRDRRSGAGEREPAFSCLPHALRPRLIAGFPPVSLRQQRATPTSTLRRLSWTSPGKGGAFHHSNCRRRSPWATSHRRRRTNPGSRTSRTVTKSCWPLRRKCQCRQWFLERRAGRPHPRKHPQSSQPCCKFSGPALTKSATVCRSQLFSRWSGTSLVILAAKGMHFNPQPKESQWPKVLFPSPP